VRWDSPPVLVVLGTLAVHTLLLTAGDAIATFTRYAPEPAPELELVDIVDTPEPPALPKPPPPPLAQAQPPPQPQPRPEPRVRTTPTPAPRPESPHPQPQPPPDPVQPAPPAAMPEGGAPTVAMPDIAPAAYGVAVARAPITRGHIGRGGTGTGTGSGSSGGSEPAAPVPMSVATIKTRALPHGDYSYFGAGKDYPAEARTLAIEGTIRVRLVVDAHGAVTSTRPLNRLGHGLDELADHYAHAIVFDPARDTDDQPVASVVVWTFQFALPH
jgi:TonB family protein